MIVPFSSIDCLGRECYQLHISRPLNSVHDMVKPCSNQWFSELVSYQGSHSCAEKHSWIAIMINNSCTFKARMKMMTCQISDPVHNNPAMRLRWSHCCPPILLQAYNYVHDLNFDTGECKMHAISKASSNR